MDICCCWLADVASLTSAAGLLLPDLSWNNVEQVPGRLPLTLLSLSLSYNRLCDLSSTLAELAKLPKLRILHLKASLGLTTRFTIGCLPKACKFTLVAICCSICQSAVERLYLTLQRTALHCRETGSACSHPTCQPCSKRSHCCSTFDTSKARPPALTASSTTSSNSLAADATPTPPASAQQHLHICFGQLFEPNKVPGRLPAASPASESAFLAYYYYLQLRLAEGSVVCSFPVVLTHVRS